MVGTKGTVKRTKSRLKRATVGDWVIVVIMLLLIATCILPIMSVVATSLSDPSAIMRQEVSIFPRTEAEGLHVVDGVEETYRRFVIGANFDSYRDIINDSRFMRSLAWTAILTLITTIVNLTMTVLCAYPLTYDNLKGRKIITFLIIFTMYFQAGIIPMYVLLDTLSLIDNPLVLILPGMISVFLMIIMRKFFLGIPDSLKESAEIDGAGPFMILTKIYLPLSTPALATLGLMYAVGRWNGFADALMFLPSPDVSHFRPIQLLLFHILQGMQGVDTTLDAGAAAAPGRSEAVRAAAIVVAMVPILCVYPWLQKYFVAGVTLGAVKG
ncbi:MAG: carbohydrate ABC transporter permease [Defluviitaleaceae bacterium]|nr:carbohydrate ABC transporter permease [Defluviitaleaceae bacterium]